MARQFKWENRIVGHDNVDPKTLLANEKNFKIHGKLQKRALAGAIFEVGFTRSLTVNKKTGRVLDGHLRLSLAIDQNQPTVPVEYVDLTEAEEAQALATMDPVGAMADIDRDIYSSLLKDVHTNDIVLTTMFSDILANEAKVTEELKAAATTATEPITPPPAKPEAEKLNVYVQGQFQTAKALPLIYWRKVKLQCTDAELDGLEKLLVKYRAINNTDAGFVGWIAESLK